MAEQVANIEGLGMVRLIFRNNLKGSMFNFHVDVAYKANENLLYYLDRSVEINKDLSFTAEFFPEHDGYMITSINNVSGSKDEETWWSIQKEPEGIMLDRGVSSYTPQRGENISFNFEQGYNFDSLH
ncbi:uncharacterized protein LOC106061406 isoform X1 [Biomphalaria glabrata]|uniref:Uncharacterized protein LOC106061406 isoform X1 n=1 Tax=Biomphalaria glabrata TaxID=6526 RepID=A0A9W2YSD6_BIOGL|nr:uncharacterized protein LOC106061406 isoform X1 [Biomphalaria glabrata]